MIEGRDDAAAFYDPLELTEAVTIFYSCLPGSSLQQHFPRGNYVSHICMPGPGQEPPKVVGGVAQVRNLPTVVGGVKDPNCDCFL